MTSQSFCPACFLHRRGRLAFSPGMPLLMGILNVTPDSFSDGGRFDTLETALAQARRLLAEGADMLDVGGESTRPGFHGVSPEEECRRVVPVIRALRELSPVPISVDTSKGQVARAALEAGADIVNDVTACRDPEMLPVLAAYRPGVVLMDDLPLPEGEPALPVVRERLRERRRVVMEATGLPEAAFLLDPGVGFGKSLEQNLQCIRHAPEFALGESGVLLGVSRKSYIGRVTGEASPMRRLPGTLASALVAGAVQVLRVHDVGEHRQALLVAEAIRHS